MNTINEDYNTILTFLSDTFTTLLFKNSLVDDERCTQVPYPLTFKHFEEE